MRGGLGFLRQFEILEDDVQLSLYSDRFKRVPDGLFGGMPGSSGYCHIRRGADMITLKSKDKVALRKGDVVTLAVGGGAGYGPLEQRASESRLEDLAEGYVTQRPHPEPGNAKA
jgi:N-methylhydantoinase B